MFIALISSKNLQVALFGLYSVVLDSTLEQRVTLTLRVKVMIFFYQTCKLVRFISMLSLKLIPWSVLIFLSLKSILPKLYTHSAETVACTQKRCITNLLIMIFLIKWRNDDDSTYLLCKDIDDNVKNVLRRLQPWPFVQSSPDSFHLFRQPCATLVSNLVKFGCILSTWSNTELWLKTNTQTNTHSHFHEWPKNSPSTMGLQQGTSLGTSSEVIAAPSHSLVMLMKTGTWGEYKK